MRTAVALLLTLLAVAARAADTTDDLDFDVRIGAANGHTIAVTLTLDVEQLRFVIDGNEQSAVYSVVVNGVRVADNIRVTAPRNTMPRGQITRHFEIPAGTRTAIVVVDENAKRAGTRVVAFDGKTARVEPVDEAGPADAKWREVLARANAEKKPIVIFFRSRPCPRCMQFERDTVAHPATQRRLPNVVFATLPATAGEAAKRWDLNDAGVALFDRSGVLRVRWRLIPATLSFATILDAVSAVAPQLERVVQHIEHGQPQEADFELASVFLAVGHVADARAALARARTSESRETQQAAIVTTAMLDARDGNVAPAIAQLERVIADPATPALAAEAARARDTIRRGGGDDGGGVMQILPLDRQLVAGRLAVRTRVDSAAVARVVFSLDGRNVARADRPPFSATLDFGAVPERHVIRVLAQDRNGRTLGYDERVVNEGGETFWLRLTAPRGELANGRVRVAMSVRVPVARVVRRVVVSWNDAERAVLTAPPWETTVDVPAGQVGYLRAVAELDDGRTSEDAVLLNAGVVGQSNVQLVQLPITLASAREPLPPLAPERIHVREGSIVRRVESIATSAETPLTVGFLIDVSDSMQMTLPDVQEAAIRFVETALAPRDRAFLVTFDTEARLLQPPTSDVALLRRKLMTLRTDGLTALNDALAIGLLQFEGVKGRRAMIVFTDGVDRTSRYRAAEVRELARRANVPIHVVAVRAWTPAAGATSTSSIAGMWSDDPPNEELRTLAEATGGTFHLLDTLDGLPAVYAQVEAALRAQYLAFVRTEPATKENDWRAIDVKVDGDPAYAPSGYYATW